MSRKNPGCLKQKIFWFFDIRITGEPKWNFVKTKMQSFFAKWFLPDLSSQTPKFFLLKFKNKFWHYLQSDFFRSVKSGSKSCCKKNFRMCFNRQGKTIFQMSPKWIHFKHFQFQKNSGTPASNRRNMPALSKISWPQKGISKSNTEIGC